jgi:cytochrome b subunit of formate dehydrogenase
LRILRFDNAIKVMHWSHALVFIWLLVTGMYLFLTPKSLLGDPFIKMVHVYAFLPFILSPLITYLHGRSARNDIKELMEWTYDDMNWFIGLLKKNKIVFIGKFNAGQKANFLMTLLFITGLSITGFVI